VHAVDDDAAVLLGATGEDGLNADGDDPGLFVISLDDGIGCA
jgi:hypothetical protein